MESKKLKCRCNNQFTEDEFSSHFKRCESFKTYFKEFDTKFGELLKTFSSDPENMFIIRILLKNYIQILESKISNQ